METEKRTGGGLSAEAHDLSLGDLGDLSDERKVGADDVDGEIVVEEGGVEDGGVVEDGVAVEERDVEVLGVEGNEVVERDAVLFDEGNGELLEVLLVVRVHRHAVEPAVLVGRQIHDHEGGRRPVDRHRRVRGDEAHRLQREVELARLHEAVADPADHGVLRLGLQVVDDEPGDLAVVHRHREGAHEAAMGVEHGAVDQHVHVALGEGDVREHVEVGHQRLHVRLARHLVGDRGVLRQHVLRVDRNALQNEHVAVVFARDGDRQTATLTDRRARTEHLGVDKAQVARVQRGFVRSGEVHGDVEIDKNERTGGRVHVPFESNHVGGFGNDLQTRLDDDGMDRSELERRGPERGDREQGASGDGARCDVVGGVGRECGWRGDGDRVPGLAEPVVRAAVGQNARPLVATAVHTLDSKLHRHDGEIVAERNAQHHADSHASAPRFVVGPLAKQRDRRVLALLLAVDGPHRADLPDLATGVLDEPVGAVHEASEVQVVGHVGVQTADRGGERGVEHGGDRGGFGREIHANQLADGAIHDVHADAAVFIARQKELGAGGRLAVVEQIAPLAVLLAHASQRAQKGERTGHRQNVSAVGARKGHAELRPRRTHDATAPALRSLPASQPIAEPRDGAGEGRRTVQRLQRAAERSRPLQSPVAIFAAEAGTLLNGLPLSQIAAFSKQSDGVGGGARHGGHLSAESGRPKHFVASVLRTGNGFARALDVHPASFREAVPHDHSHMGTHAGALHHRPALDGLPENPVLVLLAGTVAARALRLLPVAEGVAVARVPGGVVETEEGEGAVDVGLREVDGVPDLLRTVQRCVYAITLSPREYRSETRRIRCRARAARWIGRADAARHAFARRRRRPTALRSAPPR